MSRLEFAAKTKAKAFARSKGLCECGCGQPLQPPRVEYDHLLPAALGGDNSLANCRAIRSECHKTKTTSDVRKIRKADRQGRNHINATIAKPKIASPGFPKRERREVPSLPPRQIYG